MGLLPVHQFLHYRLLCLDQTSLVLQGGVCRERGEEGGREGGREGGKERVMEREREMERESMCV